MVAAACVCRNSTVLRYMYGTQRFVSKTLMFSFCRKMPVFCVRLKIVHSITSAMIVQATDTRPMPCLQTLMFFASLLIMPHSCTPQRELSWSRAYYWWCHNKPCPLASRCLPLVVLLLARRLMGWGGPNNQPRQGPPRQCHRCHLDRRPGGGHPTDAHPAPQGRLRLRGGASVRRLEHVGKAQVPPFVLLRIAW